eukprot:1054156-Heterocapsa_arctica.AAC.1
MCCPRPALSGPFRGRTETLALSLSLEAPQGNDLDVVDPDADVMIEADVMLNDDYMNDIMGLERRRTTTAV